MPRCHLSQEFLLQTLKSTPKRLVQYADKDLRGFLLEYRPSGTGTWYFRYTQVPHKQIRYFRLGNTDSMDAIMAREQAYRIKAIVRDGGDPKSLGEMAVPKHTPSAETFVFERYLPHIKHKKRSWCLGNPPK